MASIQYIPIVQQYIMNDWVTIIELDQEKIMSTQKADVARDKLREFLTRDTFWLSNNVTGECAIISKNDGPIRIKWRTTLEKCD